MSGNFFTVLGAAPAHGRLLAPSDDDPDAAAAVAVVSHRAWTTQFGRDPELVGRTVSLGPQAFTVLGIAGNPLPVRQVTLTRVLKQHRIRRIDAATLRERLRAPALKLAPGATEAATAHVRLVAERLALVNRQLDHARQEIDRLVHQLAEAAPADCPDAAAEDDPDSSTQQPDAAILLSMPGIGTGVLAALLAEAGDAIQRRDYDALRCLCGVASVTQRSGKSVLVTRRLAAHGRLRDAAYHWARVAAQRDAVSHEKYRTLRSRGHGHARALRCSWRTAAAGRDVGRIRLLACAGRGRGRTSGDRLAGV